MFISLKLILPAIRTILRPQGTAVCLIKPQFEAGREKVGKKGVVRDPDVHCEVLSDFTGYVKDNNFTVLGLTYSPIRGPEGNIEYLGFLLAGDGPCAEIDIKSLVEESHRDLKAN